MLFETLLEPCSAYREEEVVAGIVEVGCVCSLAALEIFYAEGFVANFYDAGFVIVPQHGNLILLAHLFYYVTYIVKARAVNVPWGDIAYLRLGTKCLDALDKGNKRVAEHLQRVLVLLAPKRCSCHHSGIIVTGNDNDIVSIGTHHLVALPHGGTEVPLAVVSPVESHARAVFAVVVVGKTFLLSEFIVPRLSIRLAMIGNIRVANDVHDFLCACRQ